MLTEVASPATAKLLRFVALIINPVSCAGEPNDLEQQLVDEASRPGIRCQVYRTTEHLSAEVLAKRALAEGAELVIAAGGDGTIVGAINALVGTRIPLGIVPLGTGNLLALNLGIPTTIPEAFDVAFNGNERSIDLVNVNHGVHYFAIMGGLGLDARIMQKTDRASKQRYGRFAYLLSGLVHLRSNRFWVEVRLDGKPPIRIRAKSVLVGNLSQIGPGVRLFENSSPDDGVAEVGLLKADTFLDFVRLAWNIAIGKPSEDAAFDTYQATNIEITARRPEPIEFDGDHSGTAKHVSFKVEHQALELMVPSLFVDNP